MLPLKHRLRTKADFDYVYKTGKKYKTQYFTIIAAKQKKTMLPPNSVLPRFGFVASKKVGKAVKRNRAKRLMREVIRAEFNNLENNFDAVIICFDSLPTTPFEELQKVTQKALKGLRLYKNIRI